MPVPGYKTVTIKEETLHELERLAKKNHRTVPETIEHFLAIDKKKEA